MCGVPRCHNIIKCLVPVDAMAYSSTESVVSLRLFWKTEQSFRSPAQKKRGPAFRRAPFQSQLMLSLVSFGTYGTSNVTGVPAMSAPSMIPLPFTSMYGVKV
jgi:hypothetical protein